MWTVNNMRGEGIETISEALNVNTTLTELNLEGVEHKAFKKLIN